MRNLIKYSEFCKYDKVLQLQIEKKIYEVEDTILECNKDVVSAMQKINNTSYYVLKDTFFYVKLNTQKTLRILCRWNNDNVEIHQIYSKNDKKGDDSQYIYDFKDYVDIYLQYTENKKKG